MSAIDRRLASRSSHGTAYRAFVTARREMVLALRTWLATSPPAADAEMETIGTVSAVVQIARLASDRT
jgi:hypothetical protein